MNLQPGAFLQGGKYRIEKTLGQGGFGITYQGVQVRLNREVAIKEFYMREFCNRNASNSQVSIGSEGSREKVEAYKKKFLKEAQTIAGLDNPHIVRIHDILKRTGRLITSWNTLTVVRFPTKYRPQVLCGNHRHLIMCGR